jgi:2-amino-4-hydroxy-6-hydroxymethyldihydropteridine diphosphokinase
MEWTAWAPTMAAIRAEFGYEAEPDREAAHALHKLVPATNRMRDVGVEVRNRRDLVVAGCGPGLVQAKADLFVGKAVVAVDGACERLQELGIVPRVVVTDLDGKPEALQWAAAQGAKMVVHAHGDNRKDLEALVPTLGPQVYGTHQLEPMPGLEPLKNAGGFTDGDRAVLLLEHLGARAALLVGFETDREPSRYSHRWDPKTKPAKLAWAGRIVDECHARGRLALTTWVP